MNDNSAKDATNLPVILDNGATPYSAVFAAATSAIATDAHFLSSGLKLDTELFSKGTIKNMADKDTIDTTPDPTPLHVPTGP